MGPLDFILVSRMDSTALISGRGKQHPLVTTPTPPPRPAISGLMAFMWMEVANFFSIWHYYQAGAHQLQMAPLSSLTSHAESPFENRSTLICSPPIHNLALVVSRLGSYNAYISDLFLLTLEWLPTFYTAPRLLTAARDPGIKRAMLSPWPGECFAGVLTVNVRLLQQELGQRKVLTFAAFEKSSP